MRVCVLLSDRRKWFWVVGMLCMSLSWNGVQAEDSVKGQPAPILEMGVKPKATPQELEQLRWMEIFANDIALYRFDIQSVGQNEADPNEVRMTVQAIYTDKKILNQMKTDYASRLKDDRMPVCSEMELRFHMKKSSMRLLLSGFMTRIMKWWIKEAGRRNTGKFPLIPLCQQCTRWLKNISCFKRQRRNSIKFCLMQDCFLFRFGEKQSCVIYGCDVQVKDGTELY